jgi:hypothetical protein
MPLFATTVFLSAFLLFQIQPVVAKMILPWFGGSSSVWTLCMVFFQVELLLGYAYVHLLHEKISARRQPWVHGALLLLSLATLPVVADPSWKLDAQAHPTWSVLGVLATTVGVPYLLLSTTGPLMQAWYARSFVSQGVQPYRLYALSNLASMLALLSYPVLVEPMLAVKPQAWVWSTGYALFVLVCVATAAYTVRRQNDATTAAPPLDDTPRPGWRECLMWVGLAATASMLLLAITRHLTQDVAPVPFLWVLPLALYLLSFILCFDAPRYYVRPFFLVVALPLSFVALDFAMNEGLAVPVLVALLCASVFVFCMVCHGELVRRRPPLRHLTLFYLMLSVGGALGGLFVGLVAPVIFNAYFELPLGLFLCALLMLLVLWPELRDKRPRWLRGALLLALLLYGARLSSISLGYVQGYTEVVRNFYSQTRRRPGPRAQHGARQHHPRRAVPQPPQTRHRLLLRAHRHRPRAPKPAHRPASPTRRGGPGRGHAGGVRPRRRRDAHVRDQRPGARPGAQTLQLPGGQRGEHRAGAGRRPPHAGARIAPGL